MRVVIVDFQGGNCGERVEMAYLSLCILFSSGRRMRLTEDASIPFVTRFTPTLTEKG